MLRFFSGMSLEDMYLYAYLHINFPFLNLIKGSIDLIDFFLRKQKPEIEKQLIWSSLQSWWCCCSLRAAPECRRSPVAPQVWKGQLTLSNELITKKIISKNRIWKVDQKTHSISKSSKLLIFFFFFLRIWAGSVNSSNKFLWSIKGFWPCENRSYVSDSGVFYGFRIHLQSTDILLQLSVTFF